MSTKILLGVTSLILLLGLLPIAYGVTFTTTTEAMASGGVGIRLNMTSYDPSPAKPGKYLTLYLKAENSGGDELKDATFQLELAYPFSFRPGEDGKKHVSSIGSQESVLLEYTVNVDKNALEGTYTLYLKLCLDANCTSYARTPFAVTVQPGGTPKIEVGLDDADIFSAGVKGSVTVNVVNRGLLDTKFLALELRSSDKYEIISPARMYIGELESDDFDTAEFDIYIKEDVGVGTSETINLPVLVEYSDVNDKEYSENFIVPLRIYSKSDLTKMQLVPDKTATARTAILIIAGLVALFLIYKQYKKKSTS